MSERLEKPVSARDTLLSLCAKDEERLQQRRVLGACEFSIISLYCDESGAICVSDKNGAGYKIEFETGSKWKLVNLQTGKLSKDESLYRDVERLVSDPDELRDGMEALKVAREVNYTTVGAQTEKVEESVRGVVVPMNRWSKG